MWFSRLRRSCRESQSTIEKEDISYKSLKIIIILLICVGIWYFTSGYISKWKLNTSIPPGAFWQITQWCRFLTSLCDPYASWVVFEAETIWRGLSHNLLWNQQSTSGHRADKAVWTSLSLSLSKMWRLTDESPLSANPEEYHRIKDFKVDTVELGLKFKFSHKAQPSAENSIRIMRKSPIHLLRVH